VATQGSPGLQESTAKHNSSVCIIGVNKIAPNFVTLVATYLYVVRLFKDLTARHTHTHTHTHTHIYIYIYIYMSFGA